MRRSTPLAHGLLTARPVVVSAYKGREVEVDQAPRCWNCGRQLAAYLSRPWSIRCSHHGCKEENHSEQG